MAKEMGLAVHFRLFASEVAYWTGFIMFKVDSSRLFPLGIKRISLLVFLAWPMHASALDVRAEVAGFFKDYLGRPLTDRELDEAVVDYQSFFGEADRCNADCEKALESHIASRRYFVQSPDTPEELMLRHMYLSNAVFEPRNQGGIVLKLLAEPDPVAAVDYKERRIMTKRDVESLIALWLAPQSGKISEAPRLSDAEFAKIKIKLGEYFNVNSGNKLPMMYVIAAELHLGIQRGWEDLSESDREVTLAYLRGKGMDKPLPARLYQRFLGIDAKAAESVATQQALEKLSATLSQINRLGELMMGASVVDQLGRASANPTSLPQ